MYDVVNLITGEIEEGGFDTYEAAQEYFENNRLNYDTFGIEGPEAPDTLDEIDF